MSLPCLYYLRYLISLGKSDRDIVSDMALLGFEVSREDLQPIRNSLMLPQAFLDHAAGKQVNERFLIKFASRFQMKELWTYKLNGKPRAVQEMMRLVRDREVRLIPLILTLKKDPKPTEALREIGYEYSQESVELLLHYFFNPKIVSFSAWRDILQRMSPSWAELLDQPLDYVRYRLGLAPSLSFVQILKDLMHQAYFQSKDFMRIPTRDSIDMAKKMADLSMKAGQLLEKYGSGDTRTFLDDVRLGFEQANIPIPTIEEVEKEHAGDEEPFEFL